MSEIPIPGDAVQIARAVLPPELRWVVPRVVAALDAAGWLRDPGSVAKQALKLYGRGHSYLQIADQMGITLGQARRLVLQAREGQS